MQLPCASEIQRAGGGGRKTDPPDSSRNSVLLDSLFLSIITVYFNVVLEKRRFRRLDVEIIREIWIQHHDTRKRDSHVKKRAVDGAYWSGPISLQVIFSTYSGGLLFSTYFVTPMSAQPKPPTLTPLAAALAGALGACFSTAYALHSCVSSMITDQSQCCISFRCVRST